MWITFATGALRGWLFAQWTRQPHMWGGRSTLWASTEPLEPVFFEKQWFFTVLGPLGHTFSVQFGSEKRQKCIKNGSNRCQNAPKQAQNSPKHHSVTSRNFEKNSIFWRKKPVFDHFRAWKRLSPRLVHCACRITGEISPARKKNFFGPKTQKKCFHAIF